jgi:hypothetical protein
MMRRSVLFTRILFLLVVLWEQIHASIVRGEAEDDGAEDEITRSSQREMGNLGFQALEVFNRPDYRAPRTFSFMKQSSKEEDAKTTRNKSSKSSKSVSTASSSSSYKSNYDKSSKKASKSDKTSKSTKKSKSAKAIKKRKRPKTDASSEDETAPRPTAPEPTSSPVVDPSFDSLPPAENLTRRPAADPTNPPVADRTSPPVADPTPLPTPQPTPEPTPEPTTASPTMAPVQLTPPPADQQCRVPTDECCEDSDCSGASTVCAGRNCVSEGSLRFTVTWFGQGKY